MSGSPSVAFAATPPVTLRWGQHATPCGPMLLGLAEDGAIVRFDFLQNRAATSLLKNWQSRWPQAQLIEDEAATAKIVRALFGALKSPPLERFKIRLSGTPFQQKVWKALLTIPCGEVISYAELARRIGNPKAVRAVGTALGANPVPVLIPCHRVVASNGKLGGFGGGLPAKKALLKREGCNLNAPLPLAKG